MHEAACWLLANQSCCQVTGRISASARKYWVFSCSQTTTHRSFACKSFWMRSCNSNLKKLHWLQWIRCHNGKGKMEKITLKHTQTIQGSAKTPRPLPQPVFHWGQRAPRGWAAVGSLHDPPLGASPHTSQEPPKNQDQTFKSCTRKSGSYQPSLSASQPGIPTQVTPLVDRGELKRKQSQILRLSMSQGAQANSVIQCNSCNSAVA